MVTPIASEIYEKVQILPNNFQYQVLSFVRALETLTQEETPREKLLQLAGSISLDDLEIMRETIEAGCGQVDLDEW